MSAPTRLRSWLISPAPVESRDEAGERSHITGAQVPPGADPCSRLNLPGKGTGPYREVLESVALGRSIVRQAAEIRSGETVLRAGEEINAQAIATLASFGYAQVKVGRQPRVAVMATGSELVNVDQKPARDQIRDSNNYTIEAYAKLAGATVERVPLAGDDTELLKKQMAAALERCDMLITSGGVSMGVYDFTKTAFSELGAEIFLSECLKPGKPTSLEKLAQADIRFTRQPSLGCGPFICSLACAPAMQARRRKRCRSTTYGANL